MIETILVIVLDLCIVFVVLKFLGRDREKACLLTNHKVKKSATVYKLEHHNFVQWPLLKGVTRKLKVHRGTTQIEQFIISVCGPLLLFGFLLNDYNYLFENI